MAQANPPESIALDKDFAREERLFHYTSSHGLYGILESGCLWATHFKFLNDSNEFFAARKSLTPFVELEIRRKIAALKVSGSIGLEGGVTVRDLSTQEAETVVSSMYTATLNNAEPFIFSSFVSSPALSDFRNGQLLHWATYARDGGYAIEINPHKIAAMLNGRKDNMLCQKAMYVNDEIPIELIDDYKVIGNLAQEMILGLLENRLENVPVEKSAPAFMRLASVIKDKFFESECEARLVALRLKKPFEGYEAPRVFVRHQNGRSVPYIKLFEDRLLGEMNPIEAIIVGPHPDRERRVDCLKIFLEARGLAHIEVIQSEVPYVGG